MYAIHQYMLNNCVCMCSLHKFTVEATSCCCCLEALFHLLDRSLQHAPFSASTQLFQMGSNLVLLFQNWGNFWNIYMYECIHSFLRSPGLCCSPMAVHLARMSSPKYALCASFKASFVTVGSFASFWCSAITQLASWRDSLRIAVGERAVPVKIMGLGSWSRPCWGGVAFMLWRWRVCQNWRWEKGHTREWRRNWHVSRGFSWVWKM